MISEMKMKKAKVAAQRFDFKVKVVQAFPGGKFEGKSEFNCSSQRDAFNVADRLQREFDEDADPRRSYVFRGNDPVPVYSGLASQTDGRQDR